MSGVTKMQGNNVEEQQQRNDRTMRDRLNFCGLTDGLISLTPALRVDEVRSENSVDEGRLSQTGLTWKPEFIK